MIQYAVLSHFLVLLPPLSLEQIMLMLLILLLLLLPLLLLVRILQ